MNRIPRSSVHVTGKEEAYIRQVLDSGRLAGDGPFTQACSSWLEEKTACGRALLTHSCTAALEMAVLLCELGPGDEVILPSFTFSSSATAVVRQGATPVFVDIDPHTLNIDPQCVREAVTPRTKALLPVHYAGCGCDMESLLSIAREHDLWVIEDAAQGICSTYRGKALGSLGHLGCLSFHESKNVQCGEGGALLVNDDRFIERAHILREKGTNRTAFLQGMVDKYTWVDTGSSYLPGELTAAFLLAQLECAEEITASRLAVFEQYQTLLRPLAEKGCIGIPEILPECRGNAHIFYIVTDSLETRKALSAYLKARNIASFFHYVPLHSSRAGQKYGRTCGSLGQTERIAAGLLRLPVHVNMPEEDVVRVAKAVTAFFTGARAADQHSSTLPTKE